MRQCHSEVIRTLGSADLEEETQALVLPCIASFLRGGQESSAAPSAGPAGAPLPCGYPRHCLSSPGNADVAPLAPEVTGHRLKALSGGQHPRRRLLPGP